MTFLRINESFIQKLFTGGLGLFSISLLFPENYRNVPIMLFALVIILSQFSKPEKIESEKQLLLKTLIINSSFFVVSAMSLLYSEDQSYGINLVIRLLPILVIPLTFYLVAAKTQFRFEKIDRNLMIAFITATVLFFIGVLLHNFFDGRFNKNYFIHISERINSKYGKYSIHPIYASLFISLALIFLLELKQYIKRNSSKILFFLTSLFLIIMLFVMMRKGSIFLMVVISGLYLLRSGDKKSTLLFIIFITVLILTSLFIPTIKNRFLELFRFVTENEIGTGSTSIRLQIYQCSIDTYVNEPIFGYGIGDVLDILTSCYQGFPELFKGKTYNSHNQYLGALLSSGLLGLVSLASILVFNIKRAIKSTSSIYFIVVILFFATMLYENILDRQNGVILFSFFINYFAFKSIQDF